MQFLIVSIVPKYFNFSTFSRDLLAVIKLLYYPAFWGLDINIYLVSSAVTSRPTSFLVSNRASVFLFMVFIFFPVCQDLGFSCSY